MSDMSRAQGPAHQDPNPTDDMVPPAAQVPDSYVDSFGPHSGAEDTSPQDSGAEDVGPHDFGAEDVNPQDTDESASAGVPSPTSADSGGVDSAMPAQSSPAPMPDIAGES